MEVKTIRIYVSKSYSGKGEHFAKACDLLSKYPNVEICVYSESEWNSSAIQKIELCDIFVCVPPSSGSSYIGKGQTSELQIALAHCTMCLLYYEESNSFQQINSIRILREDFKTKYATVETRSIRIFPGDIGLLKLSTDIKRISISEVATNFPTPHISTFSSNNEVYKKLLLLKSK